jgi:monoamine oxidase
VWERIQLLPPVKEAMQPQMGENVKLIVALREPVWEKQGLTSELVSDGLVGMSWAATDPLARGPVALTLFSGGHEAEQLRRLDPDERNSQAFRAVAPAYPDVPSAFLRARFVDWPGMPLTQASYSFPAPGQVTAYGPVLVDGIAGDGRAPLMFAGEHTSYAFIGYMEGALSSGVRVARTLLGQETTPVSREATTSPATGPDTAPSTTPSEVAPDPLEKEGAPT